MSHDALVSATLTTLVDALAERTSVDGLMGALTSACVTATEADAAGVLLSDADRLRVAAASADGARATLLAEAQQGSGPAVESYRTGNTTSAEPAGDPGYGYVVAVPMHVAAARVGVLALYRSARDPLPLVDVAISRAFANLAAIGLLQRRKVDQLQGALDSRVVIEQAKGIVAAWLGTHMDEAFARLRKYARDHNRLLDDVARDIVAGHLVPDDF